jgi:hypothetical protein
MVLRYEDGEKVSREDAASCMVSAPAADMWSRTAIFTFSFKLVIS